MSDENRFGQSLASPSAQHYLEPFQSHADSLRDTCKSLKDFSWGDSRVVVVHILGGGIEPPLDSAYAVCFLTPSRIQDGATTLLRKHITGGDGMHLTPCSPSHGETAPIEVPPRWRDRCSSMLCILSRLRSHFGASIDDQFHDKRWLRANAMIIY